MTSAIYGPNLLEPKIRGAVDATVSGVQNVGRAISDDVSMRMSRIAPAQAPRQPQTIDVTPTPAPPAQRPTAISNALNAQARAGGYGGGPEPGTFVDDFAAGQLARLRTSPFPADNGGAVAAAGTGASFTDQVQDAANSVAEFFSDTFSSSPPDPTRFDVPERRNRQQIEADLDAVKPGTGAITFLGGDRAGQTLSTDGSRPVNTFDNQSALAEFADANRIRQQTIDAQKRGSGVVIPEYRGGLRPSRDTSPEAQFNRAIALAENPSSSAQDQSGALRRASILQGVINNQNTAATSFARTAADNQALAALRQAQEDNFRATSQARRSETPFDGLDPSLPVFTDPDTGDQYTVGDFLIAQAQGGIGMADGGLVQKYANGGMVGKTAPLSAGGMPQSAVVQQYQQYVSRSREMGLSPVDMTEFMAMQGGEGRGVVAMAEGGMVPDASGKMVVDTDPSAGTDSIPAMIDGQQPAALDSGEFVIPKDVVLYYGTDKLNKMVEKARNPDGKPSAIQQSASAAAR